MWPTSSLTSVGTQTVTPWTALTMSLKPAKLTTTKWSMLMLVRCSTVRTVQAGPPTANAALNWRMPPGSSCLAVLGQAGRPLDHGVARDADAVRPLPVRREVQQDRGVREPGSGPADVGALAVVGAHDQHVERLLRAGHLRLLGPVLAQADVRDLVDVALELLVDDHQHGGEHEHQGEHADADPLRGGAVAEYACQDGVVLPRTTGPRSGMATTPHCEPVTEGPPNPAMSG